MPGNPDSWKSPSAVNGLLAAIAGIILALIALATFMRSCGQTQSSVVDPPNNTLPKAIDSPIKVSPQQKHISNPPVTQRPDNTRKNITPTENIIETENITGTGKIFLNYSKKPEELDVQCENCEIRINSQTLGEKAGIISYTFSVKGTNDPGQNIKLLILSKDTRVRTSVRVDDHASKTVSL